MIRSRTAKRNDRHFPNCEYEGHRRVSSFWRSNIQRKLVRFQRFETNGEEVPSQHSVYVTRFVDLNRVFVVRQDKTDRLNHMEVIWAEELKKKLQADQASR